MKKESKRRPHEIKAYLDGKGWVINQEGENWKIETCIFCGNTRSNLEVHVDRGYYKCWACDASGSFYDLKKSQGDVGFSVRQFEEAPSLKNEEVEQLTQIADAYHNRLFQRPVGLDYIRSRGFDDHTIKHFKLGCQNKGGQYWLTIPHIVGEKVVNIKYRSIPPAEKRWRQEDKARKILFNQNALEMFDEIILTEGELKTVALWQMGFQNTVSLTGGVQNFRPEWVDQLQKMKKIYLCLDSDSAGQKGAEKLAMRLGPDRCYNIVLKDAKDPDEWFFEKGHTPQEFSHLIKQAKLVDIKNIISVNQAMARLQEEIQLEEVDTYQGLMTQWDSVNQLTKGFKPGELIILSAPPKYGKTTFALNIVNYHVHMNNPCLFFCMEMSALRLARKLTCLATNINDEEMDITDVTMARRKYRGKPLFLPDNVKVADPEEIFESMRAAYRRYGLKLIVFDNLHFLVRSVNNLREQIGQVSQGFKLLAEELQIPIILIVHPRKLNKKRAMEAEDFKESASIHADCDQIIMLHRTRKNVEDINDDDPDGEKDHILSPETTVIVDASRFSEGGVTKLHYDGAKSKFIQMGKRRF
jgi:replicative DNA helicase/5S rRNA maturation endonuclease (ribonuclease M5)